MNPLKRSASAAFPSDPLPAKVARRTTSSPAQQEGLAFRWKSIFSSLIELLIDTAAQLSWGSKSYVPSFESHGPALLPIPSALESESAASNYLSSTQPSSSSSQESQERISHLHQPIPQEQPTTSNSTIPHVIQSSRRPVLLGRQGVRKRYPRRPHIHQEKHKETVREKLKRELYALERAQGYSSDFATFKSLLEYRNQVDQASKVEIIHDLKGSVGYKTVSPNNASYSSAPMNTEALQRALVRARDSLTGPGPARPFVPTLEQMRVADKAKDRAIEKRIRPPLPEKLPPEAMAQVLEIISNPKFISKAGREQVSYQDLQRLRPGQWLNDEVINFYGQLIVERSLREEAGKENIGIDTLDPKGKKRASALKVHYFNTFFWPKAQMGYAKANLRKWTKRVDIFSKDVIIIPINHNQMHWSAAVINFRQKRIESYDSLDVANSKKSPLFHHIRSYLQHEHKDKRGRDFDFSGWQNYGRADTPQQENGFDCGVFTMQFLESAARGEEGFSFSQQDMSYLRQRMIWEIGRARLGDDR